MTRQRDRGIGRLLAVVALVGIVGVLAPESRAGTDWQRDRRAKRFYRFGHIGLRGHDFEYSHVPSLMKRYVAHVKQKGVGDLVDLMDLRVWTPQKSLLYLSMFYGGDSDAPDVRQARARKPLVEEAHLLYQALKTAAPRRQATFAAAFQAGLSRGLVEARQKQEAKWAKERAAERRRLNAHRQLTQELLARTPDDDLPRTVVDYALNKIGEDWDHEYQIVTGLPKPIRLVYAMQTMEAEVDRDGFGEIVQNDGWQIAPLAAEGYQLVGAKKRAAVVERAIAFVAQEKAKQSTDLDGMNPAVSALDDKFYACDKSEDIYRLIARYIRQHPDRFVAK